MTRGLLRRLSQIENALVPRQIYRVVLRYVGPGTEQSRQPTEEELREANIILNIRSIPARDGRQSTREIAEDRA
jgi:hypothetical protein